MIFQETSDDPATIGAKVPIAPGQLLKSSAYADRCDNLFIAHAVWETTREIATCSI